MKVLVAAHREVVVYNQVHLLHVDAASEERGRHQDARLSLLELQEVVHSRVGSHSARQRDAGEAPRLHQLLQRHRARVRRNVDHHLIELRVVQHLREAAILGSLRVIGDESTHLLAADEELLQAVQCQLLVVDLDAQRLHINAALRRHVLHVFHTHCLRLGRERGGEHHHLLVDGRAAEHFLDGPAGLYALMEWEGHYAAIGTAHRIRPPRSTSLHAR